VFGTGPVETTVWVEHVGTKSFRLGASMAQDGAVVGRATSVLVAYDYAAGTSRPLTDAERELLSAHVAP
jgi:acyl-CoA thioesterase FadM